MSANFSNREHIEVAVPVADGPAYFELDTAYSEFLSIQLCWHDDVSAFSAALFTSNRMDVALDSDDADEWSAEDAIDFDDVVAAAKGSVMKHLSGIGSKRAKLVITPAADCLVSIYTHGKS